MILSKDLILNHLDLVLAGSYFFKFWIFQDIFGKYFFDFLSWICRNKVLILFLFWVRRLLFWNVLAGNFFHQRSFFLDFHVFWTGSFASFFLDWRFGWKQKVAVPAWKISVLEFIQIIERFVDKKEFIKWSSNFKLINKVIQINPRIHNVSLLVVMSFEVVELNFEEELFEEKDDFFKLIDVLFWIESSYRWLQFVLKKVVTVVKKFFYLFCVYNYTWLLFDRRLVFLKVGVLSLEGFYAISPYFQVLLFASHYHFSIFSSQDVFFNGLQILFNEGQVLIKILTEACL